MKTKCRRILKKLSDQRGFSLLELMVVVAIMGIMMVLAGVYISSGQTKLQTFVYNIRSSFHQAKFEAVKRSRNVYLDFNVDDNGCLKNGFDIWVDDNRNGALDYTDANANLKYDKGEETWADANGNGVYDPGEGDQVVSSVRFINIESTDKHGPEIYYKTPAACGVTAAAAPTGSAVPGGPNPYPLNEGVEPGAGLDYRFLFKPDGLSNTQSANAVYFYFPTGPKAAKEVQYGPWAITVNPAGRIRLSEWLPASSEWKDR